MTSLADRTRFLARPPRADIASLCRTTALTRYEIARELQRQSGSISSFGTMLECGALRRAGRRGRAELLKLNPSWTQALDQVEQEHRAGLLAADDDLLLVRVPDVIRTAQILSSGGLTDVVWAAPLAGEQMGLALFAPGDEHGAAGLRVAAELRQAGVDAIRMRVTSAVGGPALAAWAAATSPSAALGSGHGQR